MLHNNIVPPVHKNQATDIWSNLDKKMIEWCPIISIEQHCIYYQGVDSELLEEMFDHRFPKFVVNSAMWALAETALTSSTRSTMFAMLSRNSSLCRTGQLKEEMHFLEYERGFKSNIFHIYVVCQRRSSNKCSSSITMVTMGLTLVLMCTISLGG